MSKNLYFRKRRVLITLLQTGRASYGRAIFVHFSRISGQEGLLWIWPKCSQMCMFSCLDRSHQTRKKCWISGKKGGFCPKVKWTWDVFMSQDDDDDSSYYIWTFNNLSTGWKCRFRKKWRFLKGYCIPNQKLACSVLYLKIINIFLKNKMYLEANCPRNSKMASKF